MRSRTATRARAAGRILVIGAGLALLGTAPAPGQAQEVIQSQGEIAVCLCQEQSVGDLKGQMEAEKRSYDAAKTDSDQLQAQVEAERPKVNRDDIASINAFKQLLDRRDAAERRYAQEETARYAEVVRRYNAAVESYNGSCGGKSYDAVQLAQVKQTLVCPK